VVQLVLADRSGAGGPRVAFADGVFDNASLNSSRSSVGKYRTETQSVDFQKKV